jgi:hypothetical protein
MVGAADTVLARDAANTLALRNGANAQTFRAYNTFTDASNYERASFGFAVNVLEITTENAGTGTLRALRLNGNNVLFRSSGTGIARINGNGLMAETDGAPNIGAKGATRFLNGFFSSFVTFTQQILTKTADYTVLASETGAVYTNSGAAGQVIFTLPTWAAGLFYMFDVETAQNLRVVASGTDTIRIAGSVSAAGGRIDNATVGGVVTLVATLSGKWVATSQEGTWTVT